jgi:hypothetical protein
MLQVFRSDSQAGHEVVLKKTPRRLPLLGTKAQGYLRN